MDGASSLAGLIGLAALVAQSTTKAVKVVKALKAIPEELQNLLEWLEKLNSLLEAIRSIPPQAQIETPLIGLLSKHVLAASDAIARLSARLNNDKNHLDDSRGPRRQVKKVRILLHTEETERGVQEVRKAVESLELCYSEISRRVLLKTSNDITAVNEKIDSTLCAKLTDISSKLDSFDLQGGHDELFRRIAENIHVRSSHLERQIRRLDAAMSDAATLQTSMQGSLKASLIAEIKSAILPELKGNFNTSSVTQTELTSSIRYNESVRDGEVGVRDTDRDHLTLPNELEITLHAQNSSALLHGTTPNDRSVAKGAMSVHPIPPESSFGMWPEPIQTTKLPSFKQSLIHHEVQYLLYYEARVAWLGSLKIIVRRTAMATLYRLYRKFDLDISLTPNYRLIRRGVHVHLAWNAEDAHFDSLSDIQLYLPRILPSGDPLVKYLIEGATENFIDLFRTGPYSIRDEMPFRDKMSSRDDTCSLVDVALWQNYDICIFLLQNGAKFSWEWWQRRITKFLHHDSDKALQCTRLAITNGVEVGSIPALNPCAFQLVFNAIYAYPHSPPAALEISNMLWVQRLQIDILLFQEQGVAYIDDYDVQRDNLQWKSFMKQYPLDVRSKDSYGDDCWSALTEILTWYFLHSETNDPIQRLGIYLFESRGKELLRLHADPCQIDSCDFTPTLRILILDRFNWQRSEDSREFMIIWMSALSSLNVDIVSVARHTFRYYLGDGSLPERLNEYFDDVFEGKGFVFYWKVEDILDDLLDTFARCGIYPDESWWEEHDHEPNVWDRSATATDFTPSTIFDSQKQDLEVRRRRGRIVEEEQQDQKAFWRV